MGCSMSIGILSIETVSTTPEYQVAAKEFELLKMTDKEIDKLYDVFGSIVTLGENTITLATLLEYVDVPFSYFVERIFVIFSASAPGELDFRAFALNVWNLCTLPRKSVEYFLFDLYDKKRTGILTPNDISNMFSEIHCIDQNQSDVYMHRATAEMLAHETSFTSDRFYEFMASRQPVLARAFHMQRAFQKKLGGMKLWTALTTRRDLRALNNKYVSIAHLLHSDHRSMHSLAVVPRPPVKIFFDHLSSKSNSAKSAKSGKSNKVYVDTNSTTCSSPTPSSGSDSSRNTIVTVYRKPFRPSMMQTPKPISAPVVNWYG